MKVKALVSFAGKITMIQGDVKDIEDKEILNDLVQAKYVEEVKSKVSTKKVDK